MITTAYFRVVDKNLGVIIPTLVSKKTTTGISNAIPQPKIKLAHFDAEILAVSDTRIEKVKIKIH